MPDFDTPTGEKVQFNADVDLNMYNGPKVAQALREALDLAADKTGNSKMSEPRNFLVRLDGDNYGVTVVPF